VAPFLCVRVGEFAWPVFRFVVHGRRHRGGIGNGWTWAKCHDETTRGTSKGRRKKRHAICLCKIQFCFFRLLLLYQPRSSMCFFVFIALSIFLNKEAITKTWSPVLCLTSRPITVWRYPRLTPSTSRSILIVTRGRCFSATYPLNLQVSYTRSTSIRRQVTH